MAWHATAGMALDGATCHGWHDVARHGWHRVAWHGTPRVTWSCMERPGMAHHGTWKVVHENASMS
eukprot:251064-Chlamydomonas_euryale.AAC.3